MLSLGIMSVHDKKWKCIFILNYKKKISTKSIVKEMYKANERLTHWGIVTLYGDMDLGQYWHQAITWTNVDLPPVKSNNIHLRAISQKIP